MYVNIHCIYIFMHAMPHILLPTVYWHLARHASGGQSASPLRGVRMIALTNKRISTQYRTVGRYAVPYIDKY